MRNSDMDLLFSIPSLTHGTTVTVSGSELKHSDLLSDIFLSPEQKTGFMEQLVTLGFASGRSQKHWTIGLCRLQAENGLKVTGLFDRNTRKLFVRGLAESKSKAKAAR